MVVRFVEADTGSVVMQLPTQTTLDLIASLTKASASGQSPAAAGQSPGAGFLVNQSA